MADRTPEESTEPDETNTEPELGPVKVTVVGVLLAVKPVPEILKDEPTIPDVLDNPVIVPAKAARTGTAGKVLAVVAMIIEDMISRKSFFNRTFDFLYYKRILNEA